MRGLEIFYLNGSFDLINSDDGVESGSIDFKENDILVGMTYTYRILEFGKLRNIGFNVIRDGLIYQYPLEGLDLMH